MNAEDIAAVAVEAALSAVAARQPDLLPGTVVELAGPTVMVRIDGSQQSDAQPNRGLVPAQVLSDPPAVDQRVMVLFVPPAGAFVIGSYSGDRRLLGWASSTTNQLGISAATDLDGLEVEFEVTQPNRLIAVTAHVFVEGDTADRTADLRLLDDAAVELARVARYPFVAAGAQGLLAAEVLVGDEVDPVDVAEHAWHLQLRLTGGTGVVDVLAATSRATLAVYDVGPVTAG